MRTNTTMICAALLGMWMLATNREEHFYDKIKAL